jgi:Rrf2 family protein
VQLPIKAHYATLAMLALADKFADDQLIPARVIAREQSIPGQFLGQILQQLRGNGLIVSTRGSSGGFRLARRPADISIAEIIDSVYPWSASVVADASETTPLSVAVLNVWRDLNQQQRELLEGVSLADLLLRVEKSSATMFYI